MIAFNQFPVFAFLFSQQDHLYRCTHDVLSNSLSGQIAGAVGDNTYGHSIQSDLDFEEAYPDYGIQDNRLQTKKDTADQGQSVRPAGLARLNSQQGT